MKLYSLFYFFIVCFATMLLHSCTIEKRHYRNGFYIDFAKPSAFIGAVNRHDSIVKKSVERSDDSLITSVEDRREEDLICDTIIAQDRTNNEDLASPQTIVKKNDRAEHSSPPDEPPPTKDQPNKTIVILLAIAFFLVACFLLTNIAFLPYWLVVALFIIPFIGVVLYVYAMYYRKKLMRFKAAGATGEKYRVSAHYHRFKIFLLLFFASVLLGLLGFLLVYSTGFGLSGIFGLLGIFMTIAGIGFTELLAVILLVMFIIYLLRWRKDPTGIAKKREPRPPKGQ